MQDRSPRVAQGLYDGFRPGSSRLHPTLAIVDRDYGGEIRNVRVNEGSNWHNDPYKCWEKLCGGRKAVHDLEIRKHEARVAELNGRIDQGADRWDYRRRYDELMARRLLHEDFNTKMALLGAPQVRHNFVCEEQQRSQAEGRTLTPMAETFYNGRLAEYSKCSPMMYSRTAIEAARAAEIQAMEDAQAQQMTQQAAAARAARDAEIAAMHARTAEAKERHTAPDAGASRSRMEAQARAGAQAQAEARAASASRGASESRGAASASRDMGCYHTAFSSRDEDLEEQLAKDWAERDLARRVNDANKAMGFRPGSPR